MTNNTTPASLTPPALLQLIESYVEKRHTHGAPQYNVVTARARDAVLAALSAAQGEPEISTKHGPWIESTLHEGETYCKRCLVRSVFADRKKCEPHIVAPPAAQAVPEGWPPGPTLKGVTGEMTADDIAMGAEARAAQAVPHGFPIRVLSAIQQLIAYSEGSKSAEIVRHCRELSAWIDATPVAAQKADDDGDALRLACDLEIDVSFRVVGGSRVEALAPGGPRIIERYTQASERASATRIAIVRAAAAIGEKMP